jgi:ATP-dependent RNA helicase DDX10/DBP4
LEKVTSRDGLRATKNVNRKLQKLKDQIKAEKLAKKIAKLGSGDASALSSKKRKSKDEENSSDDDMNGLLVVKARHEPESNDTSPIEVPDDYDIHQVAKSRHAKKIRVEGSTSNENKHVVFGEDGEAQEDVITATVEKVDGNDETKVDYDLAQANEDYMQQVRERLERTKEQDKEDEKQRIRDKHRKKRLKSKGDKDEPEEGGMVATLATTNDGDKDDSSNSSDSDSSASESSSSESEAEEMDVAAQEDLALSLIRGR